MGRFYKTARPDFSQDFIYQPPWELMAKAAEMKQVQYDNALTQTSALNDKLNINHVQGDSERVKALKQDWEDRINTLTENLRKDGNSRDVLLQAKKIQREILESRQSGDIAKFEESAANRKKLIQGIEEEKKKKDGDIAGAISRLKYFDKIFSEQEQGSLDEVLGYEELIKRPEALDFNKTFEQVSKLHPDIFKHVSKTPDGKGYIINREGKQKGITQNDIMQLVMGKIKQDPNIAAYYKQRGRFGLSDVYNKDTKSLNIIERYEEDGKGNKKPILFDNELTSYLTAFNPQAYMEDEKVIEYSNDSTVNQALNRQHTESMYDRRRKDKLEDEINNLRKKAISKEGITQAEQNMLNSYDGVGTYISNKIPDIKSILELDKEKGNFSHTAKAKIEATYFNTDLNISEDLKSSIYDGLNNNTIKSNSDIKALLFNKKYKSKEDFIKRMSGLPENILRIHKSNSQNPNSPYYKDTNNPYVKYGRDYELLSKGDNTGAYTENLSKYYGKQGEAIINSMTDSYNKLYSDKLHTMQLYQSNMSLTNLNGFIEQELNPDYIKHSNVYIKNDKGKLELQENLDREDLLKTIKESGVKKAGYTGMGENELGNSFNTVIETNSGKQIVIRPLENNPYHDVRTNFVMNDPKVSRNLKEQIINRDVSSLISKLKGTATDGTNDTTTDVDLGDIQVTYNKNNSQLTEAGTFTVAIDGGGFLTDGEGNNNIKEEYFRQYLINRKLNGKAK